MVISFTNSRIVMAQRFANSATWILDVNIRMCKTWTKANCTSDTSLEVSSLCFLWLEAVFEELCQQAELLTRSWGFLSFMTPLCPLGGFCEVSQSRSHVFEQRLQILTSSVHSSAICHQVQTNQQGWGGDCASREKRHSFNLISCREEVFKSLF